LANRHVLKDGYWKMRIKHPYSMVTACDDLAATCGQEAIAEHGEVLHGGDLLAQSRHIIATKQRTSRDLNLPAGDLSRVMLYTSETDPSRLEACASLFRQQTRNSPPVMAISIPAP
tara:strand:- start:10905 stop:11252 length:348 start_codon:yes stop_codon:yes gene_type:complete